VEDGVIVIKARRVSRFVDAGRLVAVERGGDGFAHELRKEQFWRHFCL